MANDDWKYKELPKAAGETAPAVWNPKENKWEVYTGSTNVVELENKLETIEEQQKQILERLDGTFNTQVTGSNVEYPSDYPDSKANERLEAIEQTQESIISALQTTNENLKSVIDDGRIQSDAVLKGSNVDFKNTKIENNDVIGNGESESFAVFSSDGLLARVSNFYFRISAPENATTGKHRIIIGIGGTLTHNRIIEKSANFDQSLSVTVTDEEVLNAILSGLYMDSEDNYLRVYYQNNTDVDQENSRITSVKSVEGVAIV